MEKSDKIYIAGHRGMAGSAILGSFRDNAFSNIITRTRSQLDLINQRAVEEFFSREKPEIVILAAARVGGIKANMTYPADFLYENLMIQNNVIHSAARNGVRKLCFLGSSCIYPRKCPQPMKEGCLMTGPVEPTNEGYAIAKLAGYKMCSFYKKQYGIDSVSLMPCSLYGGNDHFDLEKGHVMAALVKRFTDAVDERRSEVTLWGTGSARREFMHVDDLARAVLFFMEKGESTEFINIGPGTDVSIKELALMIAAKTGFKGKINWDTSKPDGMPRKCLDVSEMLKAGFRPMISLDEGLDEMVAIYADIKKKSQFRKR